MGQLLCTPSEWQFWLLWSPLLLGLGVWYAIITMVANAGDQWREAKRLRNETVRIHNATVEARNLMVTGFSEARALVEYGASQEGVDLLIETADEAATLLNSWKTQTERAD